MQISVKVEKNKEGKFDVICDGEVIRTFETVEQAHFWAAAIWGLASMHLRWEHSK